MLVVVLHSFWRGYMVLLTYLGGTDEEPHAALKSGIP